MTNDLQRYFESNSGNRIHKWMHYFDIYERHFSRFRGTDVHLLEIGVAHGGKYQGFNVACCRFTSIHSAPYMDLNNGPRRNGTFDRAIIEPLPNAGTRGILRIPERL